MIPVGSKKKNKEEQRRKTYDTKGQGCSGNIAAFFVILFFYNKM